ncbi:group II intron maturase-specific domain-containing protein [Streptomyces sp. NPDC007856]|uniref:group II intron maturase-specific domain-containing protein n=1 Tax=Streptomyces sp. NPDC007856 TaxID=3364781 RepID=UPI003683618D
MDRKAAKRLKATVRRYTSRTWGVPMKHRLDDKLSRFVAGWVAYFGLASSHWVFEEIDQWTRRRLRQARWCSGKRSHVNATCFGNSATRPSPTSTGRSKLATGKRCSRQSRLKAPSIAMNSAYWESKDTVVQVFLVPLSPTHALRSAGRTAGCGPACPVVWAEGRENRSSYPIAGQRRSASRTA